MILQTAIPDFQKVIDFCICLEKSRDETWEDDFGKYRILICDGGLHRGILNTPISQIFNNSEINFDIPINLQRRSNYVVSVGSFDAHNAARRYCDASGKFFISVPAPLSNDSFGTNRVSPNNSIGSITSVFPTETIFDINLLSKFPLKLNTLGVGEFIGLYFSVIDYCLVRNINIPQNVIDYICVIFDKLIQLRNQCPKNFFSTLAVGLTFKCLIMRKNEDHQIGCGADHLFAGVINQKFGYHHGKSVYLGGMITQLFFPEWIKYGLESTNLLSVGKKLGIVPQRNVDEVFHIANLDLVQKAIQFRPGRLSCLHNLIK